tara:strand:+ start:500 stop:1111 length:612 start_codon:yes stop_codon:yes gene_type:complete
MSSNIKLHKEDLPAEIHLGDKIAVDSEFTGLDLNRDRLCLIQLSSGKNDAHIIKLNKDNYNSPNLKKIFNDKKVKKIFHYARSDCAFIKKYLEVEIENIECTKIMSKIGRSYSDKHGLKDLIKEFIGIDISKQLQSSDFGGDLSDKQLSYCANDVLYLVKIYDSLSKILKRENRLDLYNEAKIFIKTRVNLDLASFKEDIWSH